MLARVYDKPIVGLPIVLVRSTLLPGLVTAADSSLIDPRQLEGKTVGVRSYSQTSGVWVRGILQDGFGVDLSKLKWLTFEGAHLDEYADPPFTSRAPGGSSIADMVKGGELAAAVGVPLDDGLRSLVPDAARAEADWAAKAGIRTVNHIVALKQSLVDADPTLPRKLIDAFHRARGVNASVPPIGIEPNRPAFEALARYAHEQGITPRRLTVDELFPTEQISG
jgi:4,5-dihydroxyphthalate decarboxylase